MGKIRLAMSFFFKSVLACVTVGFVWLLLRESYSKTIDLELYFGFSGVPFLVAFCFFVLLFLPSSFQIQAATFKVNLMLWAYWLAASISVGFIVSVVGALDLVNS